jgi:peptidyl-prolyl cis-trans isomerase C
MSCQNVSTPNAQKNHNALTIFSFVKFPRPLPPSSSRHYFSISLTLLATFILSACGSNPPATNSASAELPTPIQVTPTLSPPVATVNSEEIPKDLYEIHLAQYQAAQAESGTLLASEGVEQIVLDDLIDRLLLAQGARAGGFALDDATLDQRLAAVAEQAGGQEPFNAWLATQGYTAEQFRKDLGLEIEAGWMRAQITDSVPMSAEQVEARQILLPERFEADRLLSQLQGGTPFDQVALNNDPQGLGYLGWFPRDYLLQPEVEEAAFALQPGEFSQVIETELGFHLIEVLNRDANRTLSPQQRLKLQVKALADWLDEQRAQSTIENLLP